MKGMRRIFFVFGVFVALAILVLAYGLYRRGASSADRRDRAVRVSEILRTAPEDFVQLGPADKESLLREARGLRAAMEVDREADQDERGKLNEWIAKQISLKEDTARYDRDMDHLLGIFRKAVFPSDPKEQLSPEDVVRLRRGIQEAHSFGEKLEGSIGGTQLALMDAFKDRLATLREQAASTRRQLDERDAAYQAFVKRAKDSELAVSEIEKWVARARADRQKRQGLESIADSRMGDAAAKEEEGLRDRLKRIVDAMESEKDLQVLLAACRQFDNILKETRNYNSLKSISEGGQRVREQARQRFVKAGEQAEKSKVLAKAVQGAFFALHTFINAKQQGKEKAGKEVQERIDELNKIRGDWGLFFQNALAVLKMQKPAPAKPKERFLYECPEWDPMMVAAGKLETLGKEIKVFALKKTLPHPGFNKDVIMKDRNDLLRVSGWIEGHCKALRVIKKEHEDRMRQRNQEGK